MAKNVWAIQPIDRLEGKGIATEFPGIFKESEIFLKITNPFEIANYY